MGCPSSLAAPDESRQHLRERARRAKANLRAFPLANRSGIAHNLEPSDRWQLADNAAAAADVARSRGGKAMHADLELARTVTAEATIAAHDTVLVVELRALESAHERSKARAAGMESQLTRALRERDALTAELASSRREHGVEIRALEVNLGRAELALTGGELSPTRAAPRARVPPRAPAGEADADSPTHIGTKLVSSLFRDQARVRSLQHAVHEADEAYAALHAEARAALEALPELRRLLDRRAAELAAALAERSAERAKASALRDEFVEARELAAAMCDQRDRARERAQVAEAQAGVTDRARSSRRRGPPLGFRLRVGTASRRWTRCARS